MSIILKKGKFIYLLILFIVVIVILGGYMFGEDKNLNSKPFSNEEVGETLISNLTYNEVVAFQNEEYVDQIVQWQGKFCGLSNITGIKLCVIDQDHLIDSVDNHDWFWVIPSYEPELSEYDGKWATWMLKKYGDIDSAELAGDEVFSVIGKYVLCDDIRDDPCVPTIEVIKIELLENIKATSSVQDVINFDNSNFNLYEEENINNGIAYYYSEGDDENSQREIILGSGLVF